MKKKTTKSKVNAKSKKSKTYLAVFLGSEASMKKWDALDAKTQREREGAGIGAWMKWAADHKKSIVNLGSPLGSTKRISKAGVASVSNEMGAYTLVQAESHAAAAKLFKNHPHFTIFPGDAVEVMECMPLPGMKD